MNVAMFAQRGEPWHLPGCSRTCMVGRHDPYVASLARQGRTVRVPLNRTADLSKIVRTAEVLRQKLRREPTPEEVSQATGLSLEVVQSLAALNTRRGPPRRTARSGR